MARRKQKASLGSMIVLAIIVAIVWAVENVDFRKDKEPAENPTTEVHFVDVGQGDGALVISGDEAMVIDTGERDETDKFLEYLREQGVTELKYLIITHPHTDHMGEASDILNAIPTENIIMPKVSADMTPTNSTYKYFLKTVQRQGMKITASKDGTYKLGDIEFELFTTKEEHEDLNNYSTLVKVVDGENSFLFTGDCEDEEEYEMLEQGFDLSATVLSAGHHGSSYSSTYEFLDAVNPQYAVVSCGLNNSYGHPHDVAVERLQQYAKHYYTTPECGSIVFLSDGKGLTVETEK